MSRESKIVCSKGGPSEGTSGRIQSSPEGTETTLRRSSNVNCVR